MDKEIENQWQKNTTKNLENIRKEVADLKKFLEKLLEDTNDESSSDEN